jgi:preprotein translocase subunit SecE
MNRFKEFFTKFIPEVITEMKKTSFPSRQEVVGTTGVVLITSFIFAVYLWGVDVVIVRAYEWLFQMTARLFS